MASDDPREPETPSAQGTERDMLIYAAVCGGAAFLALAAVFALVYFRK